MSGDVHVEVAVLAEVLEELAVGAELEDVVQVIRVRKGAEERDDERAGALRQYVPLRLHVLDLLLLRDLGLAQDLARVLLLRLQMLHALHLERRRQEKRETRREEKRGEERRVRERGRERG